MKKNTIFLIIAVCAFALVTAAPWVLNLTSPGAKTGDTQTGEIRELAKFPTEYSNDFFAKVNAYVNDHSPLRTSIIGLVNTMEGKTREWYSKNVMIPYVERMFRVEETPAPPDNTVEPGQDTPEPTPTPDWGGLFGDATETPAETPTEIQTETPAGSETDKPTEKPSGASGSPAGHTASPDVEPHEHSYATPVVVVAAGCTSSGISTEKCTVCGESKTIVTEPTGHDYTVTRTQKASFAHDGYTLKKCSHCGDVQVADIVLRTSVPGFYTGRTPIMYSGAGFPGIHNWYFYSGDDSIGYLQGDNAQTESEMAAWNDTFTDLKEQCDKRGVNLVVLVCPNKEQVYQEYLPLGLDLSKSDEEKRASVMAEYMKKNSHVKYVYPLQEVKTAKILYETYYQQDTHWNSVGGFVGAMSVYRALGMPTTGIQNVEVIEYEHSGGDLVSLGVGPATPYTGYVVNYKPEITVRETFYYSNTVIGGNETPSGELKIYESDSPNKHKALIIGDSFRHAVGNYIAKDFAKVTQAHRGDFETYSNYVQDMTTGVVSPCNQQVIQNSLRELGSGDLLLIMAVERYDFGNEQIAWAISQFMKSM
ncbi:MAG: hypothetical protein ILO53_03065 [Clostridia bacterium]|nr:hypothetical protein [Clostridia bacterium]